MHGLCFEYPLQDWFDFKIPKTKIQPDFIAERLEEQDHALIKPNAKIVWIGNEPIVVETKTKKGQALTFTFHEKMETFTISIEKEKGEWFLENLSLMNVRNTKIITFGELKTSFEKKFEHFELFWYAKPINEMREQGLLVL